ncbi:MAG: NAD(P)H-hydrate dehydratase [Phycisphaerales bacterium]|nr:NAD(P)H-hydrate dehydratase [Phycisphaerales bacterium]
MANREETDSGVSTDLPRLPRRGRDSHKGTFGTVVIVGGCCERTVMIGAPALAARAALRSGAGLVKLAMPAPILPLGISMCPSATGIPIPTDATGAIEAHEASAAIDRCVAEAGCLVVGPGLGVSAGSCAAALRCVQQDETSLVIDADAINSLATLPEFMRDFRAAAVFTPHPGEFKRLVAGLGMSGDLGLSESREAAAERLAQRLGAVVVLKGAGTVVTDGHRTWTNTTDHPCLATAGTGDVLTGLIAGLIAQFVPTPQRVLFKTKVPQLPADPARPLDLFEAARIGVHAHGLAARLWAYARRADAGLLASELCDRLPRALQGLRVPTRAD